MKRIFFLVFVCLTALQGFSQKNASFTQEDLKQFYQTLQGDYNAQLTDSTSMSLHFTPIWNRNDTPYRWLYVEAVDNETQQVIEQKILEIVPLSDISFKVLVHSIKHAEVFAGKWGNKDFFEGYNQSVLKGKSKYLFLKTRDFEYQTNWCKRKSLKCFPAGDRIHFKFVQEDERFYIKRLHGKSSHLTGICFIKVPTD